MNQKAVRAGLAGLVFLFTGWQIAGTGAQNVKDFTNSMGMRMVSIPSGTFKMGNPDPAMDCWDETPVHQVTLSRDFFMSETEVTLEQYRRFRPGHQDASDGGSVTGVTWHDAAAFCDWFSKKEGKPYRLPTEAEWEYSARAGTDSPFWSGENPPEPGSPNPLGLKNIHSDAAEWCLDWYGPYPEGEHKDPIGTESEMAKVIRGGGLDKKDPVYARSMNRAGHAPAFGRIRKENASGKSSIGFRVVQAPMPESYAEKTELPFVRQSVIQEQPFLRQAPDPAKPWYRRRPLLPMPPDNVPRDHTRLSGFHPGMMNHNHSPALEVCPNGDLLMVIYTSEHEYEPEVSLMGSRLRYGSLSWDMPEILFNFPDVNDHAPCLFTEGNTILLFWGNPRMDGSYPFQWMTSTDNGVTWSEVFFPEFVSPVGPHSRQPINTVFRGKDGTLYVSSDAQGGTSVLWATKDNGKTWYDTGGRTGARHTSFAELKDGRILGMGGKNTHINGYNPKSISADGGRTWEVSRTPFSEQGSNQRPCLIRLQSGRLFFCGDLQHRSGRHPEAIKERGSFVALSEDEGETWHIKKLVGTLPHEEDKLHGTIGYSVARQAQNEIIHLITTMNTPCLHFEMNEAWILSGDTVLTDANESTVRDVREFKEYYPDGSLKGVWKGGTALSGQFLLDGDQKWFYPDGKKQWEVTYKAGKKTGREIFRDSLGRKVWEWRYDEYGTGRWTQFWPNGTKKFQSMWQNFCLEGEAIRWDKSGNRKSIIPNTSGIPEEDTP